MQLPEYLRPQKEIDADLKRLQAGEELTDEVLLESEIKALKKSFA